MLPEPARRYGSIRRYAEQDLRRLRFIRHARELGFSLAEAGELLQLEDGVECEQAQRMAGEKRQAIRARMQRLQQIDQALAGLLQLCRRQNQQPDQGNARCPLISSLGTAHQPQRKAGIHSSDADTAQAQRIADHRH
ncbi:MAG: Hg(II)-responsive transcriptional regulator [Wenzhouxiangellaceae bacterium]